MIALFVLLGVFLGLAFFGALRANARLYTSERVGAALALHAARSLLGLGGFLAIALVAPGGLAPALAGFTGAAFVLGARG